MELNKIYLSDALEGLKSLPSNFVDCIVTCPPYFAQRDYDIDGQIGLEDTPEEYIQKMCEVFMEAYRVLKPEGTLWLNLGDGYWGGKGKSGVSCSPQEQEKRFQNGNSINKAYHQIGGMNTTRSVDKKHPFLKAKDMIGMPWRIAFELQRLGWWLRQDIIWHKPNPMPESVKDRCTKSHEYIFLMTKSYNYYFDYESIMEDCSPNTHLKTKKHNVRPGVDKKGGNQGNGIMPQVGKKFLNDTYTKSNGSFINATMNPVLKRQKRSVWSVENKGIKDAHFATFPTKLIKDCIKAGCPKDGIVLDMFGGSGTTALVSRKLDRNFILFELNPKYISIAEKRLSQELGLFK